MVQQIAIKAVLSIACLIVVSYARRQFKTDVFTFKKDKNSSPPPSHQNWFYQGDIKLSEHQTSLLDKPGDKVDINKAFSQGIEEKRIWTGGVIPYVFDCSLKNMPGLIAIIKGAMKEWESKTCVSFVERQDEHDYVKIIRGTHCFSTVGRVKGEKVLSIGNGCEFHNVILHELGHTIGFWHEQSRPDRDENVRILWRNIRRGWESAFVKLSYKATSSMLLPYDYSSIMHYPFNAFSKNPRRKTIISLRPVKATPYKKISKFDVMRVNMLQGCQGTYRNDVESTESLSVRVYRRMKRHIESAEDIEEYKPKRKQRSVHSVEDVEEYKPQRKQRSVECKNIDGDEACQYWAENGFCITRKDFMLKDCAKSCNSCRTDGHYRPSLPPTDTKNSKYSSLVISSDISRKTRRRDAKRKARKDVKETYRMRIKKCTDRKGECPYWASRGFCEATPELMLKQCRKSCNKCHPDPSHCTDRDSHCKGWAKKYFCTRKGYQTVMKTFCQKSCGHCVKDKNACYDKEYDNCRKWREYGLCSSRDKEVSKAMKIMCTMSCGVCGDQKQHEEAVKSLCKDKFTACQQWKKKGHCKTKKEYMNKYCKESCNSCIEQKPAIFFEDCLDSSVTCERLKDEGKCQSDRDHMLSMCKKTCGFCIKQRRRDPSQIQRGVPCSDRSRICHRYTRLGYCEKNYVLFMIKNCQKSCGRCEGDNPYAMDIDVRSSSRPPERTRLCRNVHKECDYWARIGYCNMRPDFMLRKCRVACRTCFPEKKCKNVEDDYNCKHWAKLGKCTARPNYMVEMCPRTCNACPSREVKTIPEKPVGILCPTACKTWLEKGYCSKLKTRCRRTCLARGCDTVPLRLDGFCGNAFGAGWDFKLPDEAFNASSFLKSGNWDFGAHNARLYKEDDPVYRRVGGWCTKLKKNQWLQVDLGSVKFITAVATQGRDKFYEHVKSYELGFSDDGKNFYKYKEKGVDKILRGNCDHFTPVVNPLHRPYAARFIRFYPKTFDNICMRVEVYGCNYLEGKALQKYGKIVYPHRRKHA